MESRTLHLPDVEYLGGGPTLSALDLDLVLDRYRRKVGCSPNDHLVGAASNWVYKRIAFDLDPAVRLIPPGGGPDAADIRLSTKPTPSTSPATTESSSPAATTASPTWQSRSTTSRNLLAEVREPALELFAELGIPWHNGTPVGLPSNHLLSSQVQCVNALGATVHDPERIVRAFGETLGPDAVEQIEPGRYLTFEYIGSTDFFGESPDAPRTQGAHCTSVDAAFLHRTRDGLRELILVEWKYTEEYPTRKPDPRRDDTRLNRYGDALTDPDGPVRSDVRDFVDLCQEPIYQLVRQQLLAHELEKARVSDVNRVRVTHVSPPANLAYRHSLTPALRAVGDDVSQVWAAPPF